MGTDTVFAGKGNDVLSGGEGADQLNGEDGADTLDGGTGNDQLNGGTGNNVYLFGRGDGQDIITSTYDSTVNKLSVLQFKAGVMPSDVAVRRVVDAGRESLELSIVGSTDKIIVRDFFYSNSPGNPYNPVQVVKFADGTVWNTAELLAAAFTGTAAVDTITGTKLNDTIFGRDGADVLNGDGGDDTIYGEDGADVLNGGAGNDTLDGGTGNDQLTGGTGNNVYLFGRGDGQDAIMTSYDSTSGRLNVLQFKEGVSPSEVSARCVYEGGYENLELSIVGTNDKITVRGFFDEKNSYNPLQLLRFSDGSEFDVAAITAVVLGGTDGADRIPGTAAADTINGWGEVDTIYGRAGDDVLRGDGGDDFLSGDDGEDTLIGGAGNDTLYGGVGNDTYLFGRGDGHDEVRDEDWTVGNTDVLSFGAGISADQLWFRQVGSALEVSIIGTNDKVSVRFFDLEYTGATPFPYHIEQFKTSDGRTLLDSQVQNLVNAMASFAPPAAGQTTLPANYQAGLNPVIAANWH
ncbi:calcium-binding protein [Variovorax sp. Sphag1AA]|uniref:calcium-binding protein n=1 Tax=Variovorax sp. Sphag1AA TaxID=2587027 RepID=UPI00161798AA|nr:calcium-binding protein [Variovorax sp. Sphag1AA]MBB3178464.1 Ca2+-binding RTX toxin-like protein [Variovorax sp. Sphag1AA]